MSKNGDRLIKIFLKKNESGRIRKVSTSVFSIDFHFFPARFANVTLFYKFEKSKKDVKIVIMYCILQYIIASQKNKIVSITCPGTPLSVQSLNPVLKVQAGEPKV